MTIFQRIRNDPYAVARLLAWRRTSRLRRRYRERGRQMPAPWLFLAFETQELTVQLATRWPNVA